MDSWSWGVKGKEWFLSLTPCWSLKLLYSEALRGAWCHWSQISLSSAFAPCPVTWQKMALSGFFWLFWISEVLAAAGSRKNLCLWVHQPRKSSCSGQLQVIDELLAAQQKPPWLVKCTEGCEINRFDSCSPHIGLFLSQFKNLCLTISNCLIQAKQEAQECF